MTVARTLFLKITTRSALVIGLALAFVFMPNLSIFDEKLLPEISEHLRKPVNPHEQGNALYAVYGLSAATAKKPDAVGKAVITTLQAKHAQGEFANLTEQETHALYGDKDNGDSEWQQRYPTANCNPRQTATCFSELLAEIKHKPFTHARLIAQLERYQHIIQLPHFIEETHRMDYTSPVPDYAVMMQLGKLSQAKAYQDQGINGLLINSAADMKFWRMVLVDGQTLLGRMVAIVSLRRNLTALAYAISQTPSLTAEQVQQLHTLLTPLTTTETSLTKALVGELRFSAENWQTAPKQIPAGESVILWALTQPIASTNWFYRQTLKPAFALNKLSAAEFYARAQTPTAPLQFSRINPYNLGGKIDQSKNWQYAPYIARAHDLAGIYTLVRLQLELKNIAAQDWPAAIKSSAYKNPYTAKPFDYNAAINTLSFSCFDMKDSCQIQL